MSDRPALIVSTWSQGLWVFSDGGATRAFEGQAAHGLASDGEGGAYAIVGEDEVWRWSPTDGWRRLASSDAPLSCCLEVDGRLLAGTDDARVLEWAGAGWTVVTNFEDTPGRESWYAGAAVIDGKLMGPPLGVRSMDAACDGGVLYANIHVGGVPCSSDGGVSWRPTIDVEADGHQVAAHASRPEIVAVAAAVGLCLSRDGGESWITTAEGLHASHASAVALTGESVFLSTSTDPFSSDGALYRRRFDDDGPMERVTRGLPGWLSGKIDTYCLAAKGQDLAFVDWGGALFGSRDGGDSWSHWADGLAAPSGVLIL